MTWIDSLGRDLRHAGRMIARMPVLAIVVVLSLGVGIGANLVIFSWIQAVVLKPIPGVARAASFYLVEPRTETGTNPGMSWLEYRDLRERLPAFPNLLAFRMSPLYVGEPGQVERAYGLLVSANYFSGLGLKPALGRFFLADEVSQPGGRAGGGDLARVLAEPVRGSVNRYRADGSRQQPGLHDHRRQPARIPGHGTSLEVRLVVAGDDGARAV